MSKRIRFTQSELDIILTLFTAADAGDITEGDLSLNEQECKIFDSAHAKVRKMLARRFESSKESK